MLDQTRQAAVCVLIKTVKQNQVLCLRVWGYYKDINCSNYLWSNFVLYAVLTSPPLQCQVRWEDCDIQKTSAIKPYQKALHWCDWVCAGSAEIHHVFSTFLYMHRRLQSVTFTEVTIQPEKRAKATNLSALVLNKTLTIEVQL